MNIKKQTYEKWYQTFGNQAVTPMQIMDAVMSVDELTQQGYNPHGVYTALGKALTERLESEIEIDGQWLVIKGPILNGSQHYQLVPLEKDPIQLSILEIQSKPIQRKEYSDTPNPIWWICEHATIGKFLTNNLNRFCEEFGIQASLMSMVARGVRRQTQEWVCQHQL